MQDHMEIKNHEAELRKWYAVVTRFRNEKSLCRNLNDNGIHAYVPLKKIVKQYQSRRKASQIPLINCYVFVRIHVREVNRVLETPGALHFVKFSNRITEIPESEMEVLEIISKGEYPSEVISGSIHEGDLVEVTSGVLMGKKGRLIKINNSKTFVISVESLGHSISIGLDPKLLRLLS